MTDKHNIEKRILRSWAKNAHNWISIIREQGIPSRAVTNKAIIEAATQYAINPILDLGCGEGWLTRRLTQAGFAVSGIDGTNELIEYARSQSQLTYSCYTYEELIRDARIAGAPFGTIIINYSLFLADQTRNLLEVIYNSLQADGNLIIQTVHPDAILSKNSSGQWIEDAWAGLPECFTHPYPWYAHSKQDWLDLFGKVKFNITAISETRAPTGEFHSIIFVVRKKPNHQLTSD